jgi:LmbE family N-acetylglucosaminyl deacetylase
MTAHRIILIVIALITLGVSGFRPIKRLTRIALHHVLQFLLRLRSVDYRINPARSILVLAPHPDDEAFGCGGLIALKRLEGCPVHVIFLTDGSASHPNHPVLTTVSLAKIREQEARASLKVLGVDSAEVHFLGVRDGTLGHLGHAESSSIVGHIQRLLESIKPDGVLLPFRDDGSSEHEAAFRLFHAAVQKLAVRPRVLEFPVWSWWRPFLLYPYVFTARRVLRFDYRGYEFIKQAAIESHRSQVEPISPWTDPVQPRTFVRFFLSHEEYYFET